MCGTHLLPDTERPGKLSSSTSSASATAFDDTLHLFISVRLLMSNRRVNPNVSESHKSGSISPAFSHILTDFKRSSPWRLECVMGQ